LDINEFLPEVRRQEYATEIHDFPSCHFKEKRVKSLSNVHDRIAVILPDDAYDMWLDPGFQKTDDGCHSLKPFNPA
jgi:putative SOS response-associated peptidase YedK